MLFMTIYSPAIVTHVWRGMIRWYWLAIPLEIFFALAGSTQSSTP